MRKVILIEYRSRNKVYFVSYGHAKELIFLIVDYSKLLKIGSSVIFLTF